MKKLTIVILFIFLAVLLTSCTRVEMTAADEIRFNRWATVLENKTKATLSFNGDKGKLKISSRDKDACTALSGLCFIDGKNIIICDEDSGQSFTFTYTLKNNKLRLTHGTGILTLKRIGKGVEK